MKPYIYLILLLFMLFITYEGFKRSLKNTPNKIKLVCVFVFAGIALRYLCVLGLFLARNINYLYILKPFYFLNLVCIPVGALVAIYIIIRNDKIKFSYIFLISGAILLIYMYLIYSNPIGVRASVLYGYYMEFINNSYIYVVYMLLTVLFSIIVLLNLKHNTHMIGVILVILSSIVLICEAVFSLSGKGIFDTLILSDIFWVLTFNYAISKVRKSGR